MNRKDGKKETKQCMQPSSDRTDKIMKENKS